MAEPIKSTNIRIHGAEKGKFREIDSGLLQTAVKTATMLRDAGLPAELAMMAAPITILEGNDLPFGVTKNQDVAASRLPPQLRAAIQEPADKFGRIPLNNVPRDLAQAALIADKYGYFRANNKDATVADVLNKFNGEIDLKDRTGFSYAEHIGNILQDIFTNEKNADVKKMLLPFTQ